MDSSEYICPFRTLCRKYVKKRKHKGHGHRLRWVSRKDRLCREGGMRAKACIEEGQPMGPRGKGNSERGKNRDKALGTGAQLACLRNGKKNRMREEMEMK